MYRTCDNKSITHKFPIRVKQMTDWETKEYHLKRIYDLCLKSIVKQKQEILERGY